MPAGGSGPGSGAGTCAADAAVPDRDSAGRDHHREDQRLGEGLGDGTGGDPGRAHPVHVALWSALTSATRQAPSSWITVTLNRYGGATLGLGSGSGVSSVRE